MFFLNVSHEWYHSDKISFLEHNKTRKKMVKTWPIISFERLLHALSSSTSTLAQSFLSFFSSVWSLSSRFFFLLEHDNEKVACMRIMMIITIMPCRYKHIVSWFVFVPSNAGRQQLIPLYASILIAFSHENAFLTAQLLDVRMCITPEDLCLVF